MTCYTCKRSVGFGSGGYYHRDGVTYCSEECYAAEQRALDEEFGDEDLANWLAEREESGI